MTRTEAEVAELRRILAQFPAPAGQDAYLINKFHAAVRMFSDAAVSDVVGSSSVRPFRRMAVANQYNPKKAV